MFTLRRYTPADREAVEYLHVHAIQQAEPSEPCRIHELRNHPLSQHKNELTTSTHTCHLT